MPAIPPLGTVLIAEDDAKISSIVALYLQRAGFETVVTADGLSALAAARSSPPSVMILDRMLPGLDGMAVCRLLREESKIPIIMLTARSAEEDRLEGLDSGADDYVVKPFSPRELVARVRAVLRRAEPVTTELSGVMRVGDLEIDRDQHEVRRGSETIELTPTELKILLQLATTPGRVFTRAELLERIFGWDHEGTERGIDVHVKNLRRKIEVDPQRPELIETVFGAGYRIRKPKR